LARATRLKAAPIKHQTIKPSNHQTIKPSNHQTIKPSNHQTIKPSHPGSAMNPSPTEITLHQRSATLEIAFDDGQTFVLSFEFLRVYSPSAEVRGHGAGQEVLQTGKRAVGITALEPVGNYAVQPTFSDGHNTGLYSWEYLHRLGSNQARMWQDYLAKLKAAEAGRD
jgi:DUF971 family protein